MFAHIVLMFLSFFYSIFIHITIFMLNLRCPWGSSMCCRTSGQIHVVVLFFGIKFSRQLRVGKVVSAEPELCAIILSWKHAKCFFFLSHLNCFQHSESTWCSRADWELTLNFHHRPQLMFTSNAHGLVIWTEHYFHLPSPIAALSRVDSSELDDFFFLLLILMNQLRAVCCTHSRSFS